MSGVHKIYIRVIEQITIKISLNRHNRHSPNAIITYRKMNPLETVTI